MALADLVGTRFAPYALPIIPAGAQLLPTSKISPENLGRVPGIRWQVDANGKGIWGGFTKNNPWVNYWTLGGDREKLFKTFRSWYDADGFVETYAYNSRVLIAIDGDLDRAAEAELALAVIEKTLGVSPIRLRSNNPGRFLCVFLYETPGQPLLKMRRMWRGLFGEQFAIEVLADGQSWNAEGMHRSGVPYYWKDDLTPHVWGWDNLTRITQDGLFGMFSALDAAFLAAGYSVVKGGGFSRGAAQSAPRQVVGPLHTDICPDLDMLRDVLQILPVDHPEFTTYDEWVAACVAIVTSCGRDEDFYPDYEEWCCASGVNTDTQAREKWETTNKSSLGWSYLCSIAHEYGYADDVLQMMEDLESASQSATPTPPQDGAFESVQADHFADVHAMKDSIVVVKTAASREPYRCIGGIWRPDPNLVYRVLQQTGETGDRIRSLSSPTKEQLKKAEQMHSWPYASHVTSIITHHAKMTVRKRDMDAHPIMLGVPNGYVDAEGKLRDADPSMLFAKSTLVRPDFNADCPIFRGWLFDLANRDPEVMQMLKDYLGYSITGTGQEQVFMFLQGQHGREGKTTFTTFLATLLGDYATVLRSNVFVMGAGGDQRFATAKLRGYRFVSCNEIERGQMWRANLLKEVTGGGYLEVEQKGVDAEDITPRIGLWFTGNDLPLFPPSDEALKRRERVVKCTYTLNEANDVKGFGDILLAKEGPAVLAFLVRAAQEYLRVGRIRTPKIVYDDVTEHFLESDPIWLFSQECLIVGRENTFTSSAQLWSAFEIWQARKRNRMEEPTFKRRFAHHSELLKLGMKKGRARVPADHFTGIMREINPLQGYDGVKIREGVPMSRAEFERLSILSA